MKVFLAGKIKDINKKEIESLSPGVLKARGVFETLKVYDGKIFFLNEHLERMRRGLIALKLRNILSGATINKKVIELLKINKLKNARARISIWKEGTKQRACIIVMPLNRSKRNGFNANLSKTKKNRSSISHLKTFSYRNCLDAFLDAQSKGFDEAILLNNKGFIAEASRSNIFFIKRGKLFTPSIDCGCLNGITRGVVMKIAKDIGINVEIGRFQLKNLLSSEEAFLTNSLIGVMPLFAVNRKKIGKPHIGKMTESIAKQYKTMI
ncbi:MAG: aminotransferase class IV [Candidatus Zapsychrus exili]|nr:aminotransferase class IV [Candidatus Zapsychrus exili]